jgi:hypothetical protein
VNERQQLDAFGRATACAQGWHRAIRHAVVVACAAAVLVAAAPAAATHTPRTCPRDAFVPRANDWPALRTTLMPAGAFAARLCRYQLAGPGAGLEAEALVRRRSTIAAIARRADALPEQSGTIACPLDNGSVVVVYAAYRGGHSAAVAVRLSGCRSATNGRLSRNGLTGAGYALALELRRLTP